VGVLKDRRLRTYTAALAVKVTSFGLLDRADQEARQAGWGAVLAGLGREGSPVARVQWVERTVPADGDEIGRYLGEAWDRGAVHATYWIASWPRTDVGAAFLSPLLLHAQMARAVGVTIELISPLKAIREVEAARTSDLADRELRGRLGFIETARKRRMAEATA